MFIAGAFMILSPLYLLAMSIAGTWYIGSSIHGVVAMAFIIPSMFFQIGTFVVMAVHLRH